jgi:hypothetical protein
VSESCSAGEPIYHQQSIVHEVINQRVVLRGAQHEEQCLERRQIQARLYAGKPNVGMEEQTVCRRKLLLLEQSNCSAKRDCFLNGDSEEFLQSVDPMLLKQKV